MIMKLVTMGAKDTNHRGNNWFYTYRTTGDLQFEEMTVTYGDVRKGDLVFLYGMWCHVTKVFTQPKQFQNFRAGYGIMSPADPEDFRDETRVTVGASDWSQRVTSDVVVIRRLYVAPADDKHCDDHADMDYSVKIVHLNASGEITFSRELPFSTENDAWKEMRRIYNEDDASALGVSGDTNQVWIRTMRGNLCLDERVAEF
jgi:hypothetical protein